MRNTNREKHRRTACDDDRHGNKSSSYDCRLWPKWINQNGTNHQTTNGYQIPTKCSTIEFPHFLGENLRGWIYRCDKFFEVDETPPHAKVKIAFVHLDGRPLQWHQAYMKGRITRDVPMWEEYVRALSARFSNLMYEDAMAELVCLRQTIVFNNIWIDLMNAIAPWNSQIIMI